MNYCSSRVFLFGPSHHYYTPRCALSTATIYRTPLGDLPIDLEGIALTSFCVSHVFAIVLCLTTRFAYSGSWDRIGIRLEGFDTAWYIFIVEPLKKELKSFIYEPSCLIKCTFSCCGGSSSVTLHIYCQFADIFTF